VLKSGDMISRRRRLTITLLILAISIIVDQLTKVIAIDHLKHTAPRSYLGNTFRLEYSENPGAFLSLGSSLPDSVRFWLLSVGVAVALIALFVYVVFYSAATIKQSLGMVLLISGGLSNLIDRLFRASGRVVDFMNMGVGDLRTGIFNVADVLIMIGVGLTLIWGNQQEKQDSRATGTGKAAEDAAP
jgi:signal peptidase II